MSPRRKDRDGEPSWTDTLDDVEALEGRDRRVDDRPVRSRRAADTGPARFHAPDPGEPGLGFSAGVNDAQLRRLRAGKVAPERRVDLHGLNAIEARRACLRTVCAAIDAGERCVLVVHGKGLRSAEGAVLRPALPTWLADPSLQGRVLAFCPAQPKDGGSGASYVLLRRPRDQVSS